MPIPERLRPFFWDVDISTVDVYKHKRFIIERLLKYGTSEEIKWLLKTYQDSDIIETLKISKNIDRKTANYWALHYGIKKEEVACLREPLMQTCFY